MAFERKNKAKLISLILLSPLIVCHKKLKAIFAMRYGPQLALFSGLILGLPVALFAPTDVLSTNSWLMDFVNFFDHRIDMISRLSLPTAFPEMAKLYYSVMWSLIPLWAYFFFLAPEDRMVSIEKIRKHRFLAPFGFALMLFLAYFPSVDSLGDPNRPIRGIMALTQYSRLALGILGGCVMCAIVMFSCGLVVVVKRIRDIYL